MVSSGGLRREFEDDLREKYKKGKRGVIANSHEKGGGEENVLVQERDRLEVAWLGRITRLSFLLIKTDGKLRSLTKKGKENSTQRGPKVMHTDTIMRTADGRGPGREEGKTRKDYNLGRNKKCSQKKEGGFLNYLSEDREEKKKKGPIRIPKKVAGGSGRALKIMV